MTWLREATYVRGAGGVRLAAFVFRPAGSGYRCPVLFTHNLYNRATNSGANLLKWVERFPQLASEVTVTGAANAAGPELSEHLLELIAHGYALAIVDTRGSGSSFGTREAPFSAAEALDARNVIAWLASQPWCNGRVGMFGRSSWGPTSTRPQRPDRRNCGRSSPRWRRSTSTRQSTAGASSATTSPAPGSPR